MCYNFKLYIILLHVFCSLTLRLCFALDISSINFAKNPVSETIRETAKRVEVVQKKDKQIFEGLSLFYQETKPPINVAYLGDVLLLHEAPHSSDVWSKPAGAPGPGTLKLLAAAGFRSLAIDIPGFPLQKSLGELPAGISKSDFLFSVVKALKLNRPTLVSPGASGSFASPFVSDHPEAVGGFVPIAGCCADTRRNWNKLNVPTLIVQGQFDGKPMWQFLSIPNHKMITLPNSRNGGYLENPKLFHKYLLNFLVFVHTRNGAISKSFFDWKNYDFNQSAVTLSIEVKSRRIFERTRILALPGGATLFYRETTPQNGNNAEKTVLLLHDRFLSSKHWSSTRTLSLLSAKGVKAIAVDFPGYGLSTGACEKCSCLTKIIRALNLTRPLVVSTEMSNDYSIPLLYNNPESFGGLLISGYMNLNENLAPKDFQDIQVPLLALSDSLSSKSYKLFGKMPNVWILTDELFTSRPYVDNLSRYHDILLNLVSLNIFAK